MKAMPCDASPFLLFFSPPQRKKEKENQSMEGGREGVVAE